MYCIKLRMVDFACKASTQEMEQEDGHKFESILGYRVRLFQINKWKKKQTILCQFLGQVKCAEE